MPDLTPYDTGERLEPHRWRERPEAPEDYGKVDFEDDESATVATLHFERTETGYRLVVECDQELDVQILNGEPS